MSTSDLSPPEGGRVFFSSAGRSLEGEDEIRLKSVGVDIGSSTSHLVFSELVLERVDNRYVVVERKVLRESDILLTPYRGENEIDTERLARFIAEQYAQAGLSPTDIDTGALILTGVAVRRSNARAIGELFAAEAGKFVAVSAGDGLETTLAAYGSGAVARSLHEASPVVNVDVGGGTSKIALCEGGEITDLTAVDIGARIIGFDSAGRVSRIEPAGFCFAAAAGVQLEPGKTLSARDIDSIVGIMADRLFEVMRGTELSSETEALLRLPALKGAIRPALVSFSGGVSEFIYGRETRQFGDLGPPLAQALLNRVAEWTSRIERPIEGIRATVVGAAQYTVQVSGSTIFVHPQEVLPLRNAAVIVPDLQFEEDLIDPQQIAGAISHELKKFDLSDGHRPVAIFYRWHGSATYGRLDAFCRGVALGLKPVTLRGQALVLVGEGDIGGLVGIHLAEDARIDVPILSIDGISMKEFEFIDIGTILPESGAVPVVVKSLVFPSTAALGRESQAQK